MRFNIITIFPNIISGYCSETILARAQKNNLIKINSVNLRDFTHDKHKTVDDTPYGGGAGMVMKPEPIYEALVSLGAIPFRKTDGLTKLKKIFNGTLKHKKRTVLLSPRGRQFDQRVAEEWSRLDEITFVCGRYEGIDQRVVDNMVDEEISVGPYVLAGGELGALIIIEAVARLLPGVLGNEESLKEETFNNYPPSLSRDTDQMSPSTSAMDDGQNKLNQGVKSSKLETKNLKLEISSEYPQYTKPADFRGWKVPDILLSGDHKKIAEWRRSQMEH